MNTVQVFTQSTVPFGLVYANGLLGNSNILVCLEKDVKGRHLEHGLLRCPSQPYLMEIELSSDDLATVNNFKAAEFLTKIELGQHGTAYELVNRPFQSYYKAYLKEQKELKKLLLNVQAKAKAVADAKPKKSPKFTQLALEIRAIKAARKEAKTIRK